MMYYRAVEIKDGESAEPVSFVGVHPIAWHDIASGPPAVGFVEDDVVDALLAACEAGKQFVAKYAADTESIIARRALDKMEAAIALARGECA